MPLSVPGQAKFIPAHSASTDIRKVRHRSAIDQDPPSTCHEFTPEYRYQVGSYGMLRTTPVDGLPLIPRAPSSHSNVPFELGKYTMKSQVAHIVNRYLPTRVRLVGWT